MRLLKLRGQPVYVDGLHLLALCQMYTKRLGEAAPGGAGSTDNPYTMRSPGEWVSRWRVSSRENDNIYYRIAGRLLLKNKKLYISDVGPAYLKGTSSADAADKAQAQFLQGTTSDAHGRPFATGGDAKKEAWRKRNTNDSPTYSSGADKFQHPEKIFEASGETQLAMHGHRPAPWNTIQQSPIIARTVRTLLKGERLALAAPGKSGTDRDYSRKQTMLPVFVLAIFLAEPARNERAWPINLMLLDLAEARTPKYTWDAILWHPDAILPDSRLDQFFGYGPKGQNDRVVEEIRSPLKLHLVGGHLPASPTGGGERGKANLMSFNKQQAPVFSVIPFDFIHQKEINVLLRWLLRLAAVTAYWELVPSTGQAVFFEDKATVPRNATLLKPAEVLVSGRPEIMALHAAIQSRLTNFDYMA